MHNPKEIILERHIYWETYYWGRGRERERLTIPYCECIPECWWKCKRHLWIKIYLHINVNFYLRWFRPWSTPSPTSSVVVSSEKAPGYFTGFWPFLEVLKMVSVLNNLIRWHWNREILHFSIQRSISNGIFE